MRKTVVLAFTVFAVGTMCLADPRDEEDHRKGYVSFSGNFGQFMNSSINNLSEVGQEDYPGGSPTPDTTVNIRNYEVEFEDTFGINLAVGHYIFTPFRIEVEGSYHRANFDKIRSIVDVTQGTTTTTNQTQFLSAGDDIELVSVLANALVDIPIYKKLSAYGGAGLGVTWYSVDTNAPIARVPRAPGDPASTTPTIVGITLNDDSVVFAYQMMAGLSYRVTDSIVLTGGYRLKGTLDPEFNGVEFDAPLIHLGELGIRFEF